MLQLARRSAVDDTVIVFMKFASRYKDIGMRAGQVLHGPSNCRGVDGIEFLRQQQQRCHCQVSLKLSLCL